MRRARWRRGPACSRRRARAAAVPRRAPSTPARPRTIGGASFAMASNPNQRGASARMSAPMTRRSCQSRCAPREVLERPQRAALAAELLLDAGHLDPRAATPSRARTSRRGLRTARAPSRTGACTSARPAGGRRPRPSTSAHASTCATCGGLKLPPKTATFMGSPARSAWPRARWPATLRMGLAPVGVVERCDHLVVAVVEHEGAAARASRWGPGVRNQRGPIFLMRGPSLLP